MGSANGPATTADWTIDGQDKGATLGSSAGTAGDVNNDGYADIIVGAPYWNSTTSSEGGKAYVFLGSSTGLNSTAIWNVHSPQGGAGLGAAVGTAGDVNGDGYDDIIIGAPDHTTSLTKPGRAYVYLGNAIGISSISPWIYDYPTQYSAFAYSVSTAGDVNADGFDDVIIGTDGADEVVAFYGSASGLSNTPDWSVTGNGDLLGFAVSNAGDVNGDGYDDVIIGDTIYSNGQTEEGRVLVYYGSSVGLYLNPNWAYESNQANTQFGYSVASAGDVNGDNYNDIIVGASLYDNGQTNEGGAFLFFGSGSGISNTPDWVVEGDQQNSRLGYYVGTAGDVNGDGLDDLLVGAPYHANGQANEGAVYLYYGSGDVIPPSPTPTPANISCTTHNSTDIPVTIPESSTSIITSTLYITDTETIVDVNVVNLAGDHYYINDLIFSLQSPSSSPVTLMQNVCGGEDNFNLNFDDEALPLSIPCPPVGGGTYTSVQPLSTFDGQDKNGTWILVVEDTYASDGGSLNSWGLEICSVPNGPTPTATATVTTTNTATPTVTNTPVLTPTATNTPTVTPTLVATDPPTNTPTATNTAIPTLTPTSTPLPTGAMVIVTPTLKTVELGEVFTVTVNVANITTPLSAYQFDLTYDDNLLRLENVEDGDFLSNAGQDTVCPAWVEPTANSMRLACAGVGPNPGSVGDGRLATLTFTALATGNSALTLSGVQLADTAVPPVSVAAALVDGQVVVNSNNAAVPLAIANGDDGNSSLSNSLAWLGARVENMTEADFWLLSISLILLVSAVYLKRRRQLNYIWRLFVVLSLVLQTIVFMPAVVQASDDNNGIDAETKNAIDVERELRNTANLAPPIAPAVQTTQGCYDADLDCDEDVDEADVTRATFSWDCMQGGSCYDIDADIDNNAVIDAFDLAWIVNDYDIDAPEITITSPTQGAVVTGAHVAVSGQLTDKHDIAQVTVNGVAATLTGSSFDVQIPVQSDNLVLDILAEDEVGLIKLTSRLVSSDQSGPMIKIEAPKNRQAVYGATPDVTVSYVDFLSNVDVNSFSAEVRDSQGVVVETIGSNVAGAESAQFTLSALTLDESYTVVATIADEHGQLSTTSSTFYVTDNTFIIPPTEPANPGWISGQIFDSSTCNTHLTTCDGLAGARITVKHVDLNALDAAREDRANEYEAVGALNGAFPEGDAAITDSFATDVSGTLLSGPDGFYAFPVDATGVYHIRVEKDGFTYGQREVTVVRDRSTAVNEIYLTPLDTAVTLCGNAGCTHNSADGQMVIEIPAGAIPVGDQVEVTATEFDRVFFLPEGSLPPGTGETYAFNLGGASDYTFQEPITVRLRNSRNFAAGEVIPLGYWNQHTLQWEHESVATVDPTGEWLTMQVIHFSNHDPNYPARLSDLQAQINTLVENDNACADGEEGCFINLKSGHLRDWVNLPPVNVAGENMSPRLGYNTEHANPSAIIDVQLDVEVMGSVNIDHLKWELYIEGEKTDTFTFAANLSSNNSGEIGRYRYLWNGQNSQGEQLPPGIYNYAVKISVPYEAEYCRARRFGSFTCTSQNSLGSFVTSTEDIWVTGEIALNSQPQSNLGAGWSLQNQQTVYENEAGQLLIANGDSLNQYYYDVEDLLDGRQIYNNAQPPVLGPASVDFPIETTSGGTFVSGLIDTNTTWTLAQSPYIIDGDVTVASGTTLTIEPGVQIMADYLRNIVIDGTLDASGTSISPITFTSYYDGSTPEFNESISTYLLENYYDMREINAIAVDQADEVWIAGLEYDIGNESRFIKSSGYSKVNQAPGDFLTIKRLRNDLTTVDEFYPPIGFTGNIVRDLQIDSTNRKWFATDLGVLMLAADDTSWTHYTQSNSDLGADNVQSIAVDANDSVWIASVGGGVQRLSVDGLTWTTYNSSNSSLPSDNVYSIAFDSQGLLWLGTGNGLTQFDPSTNSWATFNLDGGWSNSIAKLAIDLDDNVWITVANTGVRMLSTSNGTWAQSYTDANGLKSNNVTAIHVDAYGRKWIGYELNGAHSLSADNITWDNDSIVWNSTNVYDFATSPSSKSIWIGDPNFVDFGIAYDLIRVSSSGLSYDGTVHGGYWGSLTINGSANFANTVIEMGGVNGQTTLKVNSNVTADNLTVRAGGGHGLELGEDSSINLTNATLLANEGDGLRVGAVGNATLSNVTIQQNHGHGVYLDSSAQLDATQVDIVANRSYAIYAATNSATVTLNSVTIDSNQGATRLPILATIDSNTTWVNNRRNEIEWHGEELLANHTWLAGQGVEQHIVLSDVESALGTTLTIPAGTSIRFAENTRLLVFGTLDAVGSFEAPVYFGALDESTQWAGITLAGGTGNLEYVTIQGATTGLTASDGANANLQWATIANNSVGILSQNNATVAIAESNLTDNSTFAIQNSSGASYVVNAQNNYWGDHNGPTHASNTFGQGDAVSDFVDFSSWRGPVLLYNDDIFVKNQTATDTSQLAYNGASATFSRYYKDGTQVIFDTAGRHDQTVYADGRILAYTYNPDGTTASVEVTAPGRSTPDAIWTFNYSNGTLDNITDPLGRVTEFTIDRHNQLREVNVPGMGSREFFYNQDNLLTEQVDEAGAITSYGYDLLGRINSHTDPTSAVYNPTTQQTTYSGEVRQFTTSDTGYDLINISVVGDPDSPAPAVPTSADLVEEVSYGVGLRSTQTNEWGNITSQTDALDRTMTLDRDEANRVTRINLPNGDCLEADYDQWGNVTSVSRIAAAQCSLAPENRDPNEVQTSTQSYEPRFNQPKVVTTPAGEQVTYTYDYELGQGDAGRVVRIEYPQVLDENDLLVTPFVTFTYNSLGLVETETDVRGTTTRYVYTQGTADEAAGGANPLFAPGVTPVPGIIADTIEDDGGFGYTTRYRDFDAHGNPQTIIFPGGHQTSSTYDSLGRLLTSTDVNGIVTLFEHDDRGQVIRRVTDYTADGITGDNVVTTYAYDNNGRLIHERTAAEGLVLESFSRFDINGRLVSQSDGAGNETRMIYNDAGELIETIDPENHSTTYTYTPDGLPETMTDAELHTTRTIYDEFGRVDQTIQAEGTLNLITSYTYYDNNLVETTTAPDGTVTCFEYDDAQRRTKTIQDCGVGQLNLTTEYTYDIGGNVVYVTDPRGTVTFTDYDALGRVTLTRQDNGRLNYTTSTTYDAVTGNVDTTVGVDGTVTQNIYDGLNRLEQVCQDSTSMNLCTSYGYDRRGRTETVTDAEGVVQQTVYNRLGMAVQEIADANGLAATISYEFDDLLNLIQVTDPNGNATQYSYTARNQIESELYADGTSMSFTYHPRGNVHVQTLQDGATITNIYDAANRKTNVTFSTGGSQTFGYDAMSRMTSATQTMDGHTTTTGYQYNAVGDVEWTTQQLDTGSVWQTNYGYDYILGERTVTYPSNVIRTYKMDSINRLDSVETGTNAVIADYTYDPINHFNTVAYTPNGLTNRQEYDALGRVTSVTVNNGSSDIVDYGYGYDNVGNRTYMQRNHRPGQLADVYAYDGLYQLTNVWYGADATTPAAITSYASGQGYDLDLLGNRLTVEEDGVTESYGPNNGTQLTNNMNRYDSVEGDPIGYDLRGNTLTEGNSVYTYDILNRQTSVTNGTGTTNYVYDARGRRVAKINGGVTEHFVYDTQYRVIEERDNAEAVVATYTYGQGMDEPLTMERGGQTYYYHRDALGSVTELSNSTGAIIERYEYDVYGEVTIYDASDTVLTSSAIGNPYMFTGRRYDAESGNYYYRARYFSYELGRFLSQDPLGFDAGDYNLYRYVFNNPTNATDPTGEFAFLPWLLKAGTEAAVDALMQATINYFIDPEITTIGQAFQSIDYKQVAWAGVMGLVPGGGLMKTAVTAVGDVLINYFNALSNCEEYTEEQALFDFAFGVASEIIGEKAGELIAKYGKDAVAAGLKKLGLDEAAEKLLREADDHVDDAIPSTPNFCSFSADTVVATEEGYTAISEIEVGDYVLAFNEATGEIDYYPVTATIAHDDPVIVYLTIDNETIETTPEHPFYTTNGEWLAAGELHEGNQIYKSDGSYGVVSSVEFVYQLQPMYNLTVSTAHTYFVGDGEWLVHNTCLERALKVGGTAIESSTNLGKIDSQLRTKAKILGIQVRGNMSDLSNPEVIKGLNTLNNISQNPDKIWSGTWKGTPVFEYIKDGVGVVRDQSSGALHTVLERKNLSKLNSFVENGTASWLK